jgi:hypothetical protein
MIASPYLMLILFNGVASFFCCHLWTTTTARAAGNKRFRLHPEAPNIELSESYHSKRRACCFAMLSAMRDEMTQN